MSFTNSLKSTGAMVSSGKNQYVDIDRMFQGYSQNPYITQHSDMYDNAYYPGYMPNNPQGYGLKYGSSAPAGYSHEHEHGYGGGGNHHYQPAPETYHEVHSYGGGHVPSHPRHKSKGNSSAMSALTLLAFLFFLNILQSCLKEHMMTMNPTVMVMTAGASRNRVNRRTNLNEDDTELHDSNSKFIKTSTTGDGTEFESDSNFPESDHIYRKFFNESDIKYQNANNYYKRKSHRPS